MTFTFISPTLNLSPECQLLKTYCEESHIWCLSASSPPSGSFYVANVPQENFTPSNINKLFSLGNYSVVISNKSCNGEKVALY